ncbi:MAG: thiamine pyrophosphate-binding protein, partial [Candidatus Solibacter usitatus]|nr:thiamine pyrophosphate-binding protein [Candidatus Solibacter usitatus]
MTAAELLIQELQQRGVEWMATLCGHGLDPLFHAARRAGMRLVDTRNEQTAAYLAECYGRLTRRPGVCAVSSGVAHVNALTGVCNAFFDGAPMLLISGAGALATAGKGHFQDLDQAALAAPITTYARVIDQPEHTGRILDEAWRAAQRGPAHLTFPMDIQESPAAPCGTAAPDSPLDLPPARWPACARPLIVAGSGVYYSGAGAELLEFSLRHSIPIVTPIWDRGIVDQPSDTWCGVIG